MLRGRERKSGRARSGAFGRVKCGVRGVGREEGSGGEGKRRVRRAGAGAGTRGCGVRTVRERRQDGDIWVWGEGEAWFSGGGRDGGRGDVEGGSDPSVGSRDGVRVERSVTCGSVRFGLARKKGQSRRRRGCRQLRGRAM